MKPAHTALLLGLVMSVYGFASVYLVVTYLPPGFVIVVPMLAVAIPIAALWPSWFDRGRSLGWGHRLLRRLGVVAGSAPVGMAVSVLIVLAMPGYVAWADNRHGASLRRQGRPEAEIEAAVAQHHHQQPVEFLGQGAVVTLFPGTIGALVTTAAGAVSFRRRFAAHLRA